LGVVAVRFLSPGFLGNRPRFKRHWRTSIEKAATPSAPRAPAGAAAPGQDEVATELPPKTETVESIEVDAAQRNIYKSIRLSMSKVRAATAAKGLALRCLTSCSGHVRPCCDPRLLKLQRRRAKVRSAKTQAPPRRRSFRSDTGSTPHLTEADIEDLFASGNEGTLPS
jgi:hypothetical protein